MVRRLVTMRQRLPGLAAEKLPKFGVESMWVYHPLVSRRLARITELAGVELIAWTIDWRLEGALAPLSRQSAANR